MNQNPEGPALPEIERDESFNREYIPLPGGWEVQTKGKGSTFRIAGPFGDNGEMDRCAVSEDRLHAPLTKMAHDIRNAILAMYAQGKAEGGEGVVEAKNLFAPDDFVLHRNGSTYRIEGRCTIEKTMADCYAYRSEDGRLWIRPVSEMEDGRFTKSDRAIAAHPAKAGEVAGIALTEALGVPEGCALITQGGHVTGVIRDGQFFALTPEQVRAALTAALDGRKE